MGELCRVHFLRQRYHTKKLQASITGCKQMKKSSTKYWPSSQLQEYIERIMHSDQVRFIQSIQELFTISKSISMIYHIKKLKNKNYMISSIKAGKFFDKIEQSMIKTLQKVDTQGSYLNLIKAIYNNPTANIVFNGGTMKAFPLRKGTGQRCPVSPLLFNIVLVILAWQLKKKIR